MRFFMGTGKYTPNLAVAGDMRWEPMFSRQLKCVVNLYCRFSNMSNRRINKIMYKYCGYNVETGISQLKSYLKNITVMNILKYIPAICDL